MNAATNLHTRLQSFAGRTLLLAGVLWLTGALLLPGCGDGNLTPTPTPGTPTPVPTGNPTPTPTGTPTPTPTATPTPTPTPTPPGSLPCITDADCPDDGRFCTGTEFCDQSTQSCAFTGDPCDPETEQCDDVSDECIPIAEPGCSSDADCGPAEQCDLVTGECVSTILVSCVPGAGPCNIGNSSPGCENVACCEDICVVLGQVQCCLVQWDGACADLALSQSTCLNP